MKRLFSIIIILVTSFFIKANSQNISYEVNLQGLYKEEALKFYKNQVRKLVELNLKNTSALKTEFLSKFKNNKKDTLSIGITYWLQNNGNIHPSLYGSTIKRNTEAFKELKKLIINIRLRPQDVYKLKDQPYGKQVFVWMNFKKEKNDSLKTRISLFEYDKKKKKNIHNDPLAKARPPILKGCGNPKKYDYSLEQSLKIKECSSIRIGKIIKRNFKSLKFYKNPLLKGKRIRILTQFKFNKEGVVDDIISMSILPELEEEATWVIQKIPKATPAIKDNKPIGVIYTKPITFRLD